MIRMDVEDHANVVFWMRPQRRLSPTRRLARSGNRRARGRIIAGMFVDYIKVQVQTWLFVLVA
jgi:hypothetical protein